MPRTSPAIRALTVITLATLACNLVSLHALNPARARSEAVAAVAFRLDGARAQVSGFVGPATSTWNLDPGTYLISAVDQSGLAIVFPQFQIGDVPLIWPTDFKSAGGTANASLAAAIKSLVAFLVDVESAKLAALDHSSAGFTRPLFEAQPGQAELNDLYARFSALTARQQAATTAAEAIFRSRKGGSVLPKLASARLDWRDNLLGFFGYAGGAGSRARNRILTIAEQLSPEDQQEAFDAVRKGFVGDAANFDDLAAKLQNGELDTQAAQIESDMRNATGFGATATVAGFSVGQVVHQEGGELVAKGADLEAEVIKHTLGQVFPDISQGFDLADKANAWAEYVRDVYKNPLAVAEGEARDAIQGKIKDHILEQLHKCCEALEDDVAEAIADSISEEAMGAVPSLVESIQATQTSLAAETPPLGPTAGGHALVDLLDTFHETLTYPQAGEVDFSTNMALTADEDAATISGALEGAGTYVLDVPCTDLMAASVVYERGAASYRLTYSAPVNAAFDTASGQFSAPLNPAGTIAFVQMTKPFRDSHCTEMNSDLNVSFPFTGAGTIRGVIRADGTAQIRTAWTFLEQGRVTGNWSGHGQVSP
jgi:hypothetical protein